MDRNERRKLIWEMQKIVMGDVPYMPLYNPKLIEAARKRQIHGLGSDVGRRWEPVVFLPA